MSNVNEISKTILSLRGTHDLWTIWCDFIQIVATMLSNAVDKRPSVWQEREDAYLRTIKHYKRHEIDLFIQAYAQTVDALSVEQPGDVLGQVYMQLELGNKWRGQFFTPDSLCQIMATLTLKDAKQQIQERGYITYHEPAIGGGAMVIGAVNALRKQDINPQQLLHVTGIDVDIKSVHMAYIQLSLLGIPAILVHGNALTLEEYSHWYTPMHIMGGWTQRLQQQPAMQDWAALIQRASQLEHPPEPTPLPTPQPELKPEPLPLPPSAAKRGAEEQLALF